MSDEKIGIRRLEHYHLHGRVRLEVGHQRSQFDDRCGKKHVDRRVAEGDRPPAGMGTVYGEMRIRLLAASLCSTCFGHQALLLRSLRLVACSPPKWVGAIVNSGQRVFRWRRY